MTITITNRGTGSNNTAATTATFSPASNCTAGAWIGICVAADNSGNASHNITGVSDSIGNTWVERALGIYDPGAANAGVQCSIWTTNQNVGALQTGTVITVTYGANTTAETFTLTEFAPGAGRVIEYVNADAVAGSASASPTITTVSIPIGNAILCMVAMEAGTTQTFTADSDTTNGSWSTAQTRTVGSTTSGSAIISQAKAVTAAGTQTYNPTLGISVDQLSMYIQLREVANAAQAETTSPTDTTDASVTRNASIAEKPAVTGKTALDFGAGAGTNTTRHYTIS